MKVVTEVLKALIAHLMLRGWCARVNEVRETVEEEDVVTTASKGGQHKELLDRFTGPCLDLVGVGKHVKWRRAACVA